MKQYETYKDSGIQWLGKIPNHWKIQRIKFLLERSKDNLRVGPFGSSLSGEDFKEKGFWVYNQRTVLDENFDTNDTFINEEKFNELNSFSIKGGDLLLTTRGTIGKLAIVPEHFNKGVIHPCLIRFRIDNSLVNAKFLKHIFNNTSIIAQQVKNNSNSTTIDVIYSYTLKELNIVLPPIAEQQSIASYLDYKVGQIDATIKEKEAMLEELKAYRTAIISEAVTKGLDKNVEMKDSGIEWVEMIPKHWTIKRLKYVSDNFDGTHFSPETKETGMPYVTAADIKGKGIDYASTKKITQKDYDRLVGQGCKIETNDVLLVKDGATTGRVGLMTDNEECVALSSVAMLRPQNGIHPLFLMYIMMSNLMQTQITNSMAGSAMPRITLTKLNEFVVCVPPLCEQKDISAYIDNKVEKIDQTIVENESQIDDLKSYKSSIISEAVTGKVDLRDWKCKTVNA